MAPSTRLRRASVAAALPILLTLPAASADAQATGGKACAAPASAGTLKPSTSKRTPSVSRVRPMKLAVGGRLEIRGRNFRPGRCRTTVVFQRSGGKAVFVKAELGTRKLLKVTLPDRLEKQLVVRRGFAVPTRFRLRVLATRFGKRYTKAGGSPVIGPKPPPAPPAPPAPAPPIPDVDTDGDGLPNSVDPDDDNDLLTDAEERSINGQQGLTEANGLNPLNPDTDGDRVEDGYELRSARDLNASQFLPYPSKRPYPNPLEGGDAQTDFDGDGLTLAGEQRLWVFESQRVGRARSLDELSYSDGTKYSVFVRDGNGRRVPGLAAAGYEREANFRAWAAATRSDVGPDGGSIFDVNRDGTISSGPRAGYPYSEASYYDTDENGVLDDGERDEDADGLINVDETEDEGFQRRMARGFWSGRYSVEGAYSPVAYKGTHFDDADTDGDSVRDGADDSDFDDVPNVMELSRSMAIGDRDPQDADLADVPPDRPSFGRVNPFNPCLPDPGSRTCPRYVPFGGGYAPFSDEPETAPRYFAFE